VVQTFAMAMVTSLWILGFGSYLQAMDQQTYVNIGGASTPGNYAADVSNPCASHCSAFVSPPCPTRQPAICWDWVAAWGCGISKIGTRHLACYELNYLQ